MNKNEISRRDLLGLTAALLTTPVTERNCAAQPEESGNDNAAIPKGLRCEYRSNPLGIDQKTPRLSWTIDASRRGWKLSAYRILAASTPDLLASDRGDLWESGKVESDTSLHIVYAGKPLTARQACYWKVQVWNEHGAVSPWSRPAHWELGLLTDEDWRNSVWIGQQNLTPPTPPAAIPSPFLRREFQVSGAVQRARLYACGLGYAELYLNGLKVGGEAERDPGYTDFGKRVLYVTHDVTSFLKSGPNALGAILGTGWYDVHDLATWNFDKAPWRGRPRLRLLLAVDYADGHTQIFVSDPSWKITSGPIRFDGIYTGEVYDARQEMPGWSEAGFDDKAWLPASMLPAPTGQLAARACPPVAITETFAPVAITEPKPGIYVVDFGQNFSGHARLHVRGVAGSSITMRYGEKVHPDGSVDRSNIDYFMTRTTPPQAFQSDTYICKGRGKETWEQRFSYSGFRYAEVTGFPGRPTRSSFEGRFAHTAMESAGEFSCSNPLLNKIQRATRYSYLSNAQSIPTDCPQREKNGWMGDAHLAAEAGLMNFRSASFYTKWLDDLSDNQLEDGRIGIVVPTGGWGRGDCHPAWDSAYAIIAWDLYRYCGDVRILQRHYESIRRYVTYLASRTVDGVVPFDSLGDWVPWSTTTPSQLTSTAYLYLDATIAAKAARILGKSTDADQLEALASKTKEAFNRKFFEPATNLYANGSQTALSMALYFGLMPAEHRGAVLANLIANIEKQGHLDTGILGAKYVLRVLSEAGRTDLAYKLVTRQEQPGWGWWIAQGATTLWEDWKGESSLNHIMFGDVSNWFYQWIAGIGLDPVTPAFGHICIQPQPVGDLTWAKARYDSAHGPILSAWEKDGSLFRLNLMLPANTTATVSLPAVGITHVTESGRQVQNHQDISAVRHEGTRTICAIGAGRYRFEARLF